MSWKLSCLIATAMLVPAFEGPVVPQTLTPGTGLAPQAVTKPRLQEALGNLPLTFIENRAQADARVAYYIQGRDTTVYFASDGVTVALTGPDAEGTRSRWAVKLDFVGANPKVRPQGQDPTPAMISYFKGPRERWKTGLGTYASLASPISGQGSTWSSPAPPAV